MTRSRSATSLRVAAVAGLLVLFAVVRVVVTEPGYGVDFLQVVPIVLAAFWFGRRAAYPVAVAAAVLVVALDLHPLTPTPSPVVLWGGAAVRCAVYLGTAALVGALLDRERRSQRAFRLLADNADDMIGRHDRDGTWRYVTPSARRVVGVAPEELIGRSALELVHPDDRAIAEDALAHALAGEVVSPRMRLRRADGSSLWVETRARLVHDPDTGEPELHAASRVVDEQVRAEQALERFRAIAERSSDVVVVSDRDGRFRYLNPAGRALLGLPADADPAIRTVAHHLTRPGRRAAAAARAAAEEDGSVAGEAEVVDRTGTAVPVRYELVAHRDERGAVAYLTIVARDLRPVRAAEDARRLVAVEQAARDASEATAARLRTLVEGLGAVVWERDVRTGRVGLVTERITELLGYPAQRWREEPDLWDRLVHPADRERVARVFGERTAAGQDFAETYRMRAADGRVVWVHDIVHVARDADGAPRSAQGVVVDVTDQQRAVRGARLLAEAGRRLAEPGSAAQRLTAVAELAVGDLADLVIVRVRGDDGRYRAVAAAPPDAVSAALALPPLTVIDEFRATFRAGHAFAMADRRDDQLRDGYGEAGSGAARTLFGHGSALVVPLVVEGQDVGVLSLVGRGPRSYDAQDRELGEQLGQRMAAIVAGERATTRQRQLQQTTAALSRADTLDDVAAAIEAGVSGALGASAQSLFVVDHEHRSLRRARISGYPEAITQEFSAITFDAAVPIADCARTGEPVWLPDGDAWQAHYPHLNGYRETTGTQAAAALPLLVAGRVIGTIAASFPTVRDFPPDERAFALALAGQAAQALQRASDADRRRGIADALQRSLLPEALPVLDRVHLAAHYLPATTGTQAGGDWYDVLPLPDGRVAIAVGDVVGHGPPAAAVMGQLRSALAAYLLDGHGPAAALTRLDRFAARIPAARASTAVCVVLDPERGELWWARAGHLPPLLVDAGGTRTYLDGPSGTLLGLTTPLPVLEGRTAVAPGTTLLLYTDGLVERRGTVVDDGLERLAAAAADRADTAPADLLPAVLELALDGHEPDDDIALVVARLLPGPLELRVPASADQLRPLRAEVLRWGSAAGVADEPLEDLELAVGETTTNSVEHGFPDGRAGEVACRLVRLPDGVEVEVGDTGTWRPPPADRGYRGRGLELVRAVARDTAVDVRSGGTTVRFTVPVPSAAPPAARPPARPAAAPARHPARIAAHARAVHLHGDLDSAAVDAVHDELEACLRALPAPVLDLDGITYLGSAGVRLLVELAHSGRAALRCAPDRIAARTLAAGGLPVPAG